MPDGTTHEQNHSNTRAVRWFVALELFCLAGAGLAVLRGADAVSLALLVAPLQVGAVALLFRSDYLLLAYFVALLPLTTLELVPSSYMQYVMYGVVLGLMVFLRLTAFVDRSDKTPTGGQPAWSRAPLILLGTSVGLAYLSAHAHGWASSYVFSYSRLAIQVIVLVWLAATVPRSMGQLRGLVYTAAAGYAVVCVAFPSAVSQLAARSGGKTLVVGHAFVNLNAVAAHAAVFAAVATGAAMDARRFVTRALLLAVALLLAAVLVYTKSRGAWLGFGLALAYMIARTRSYWLILPAAVTLGMLMSSEVLRRALVGRIEATSADDPSWLGRLILWKYALTVFKDNWLFGVGFDNFRFVKQYYGYPEPFRYAVRFNSHNLFLEFLVGLGVAGAGSFLWLLIGTLVRGDRLARRPRTAEGKWLAVGLNAGLLAFLGHGLFDCIIWQHGAFMMLGLLVGMSLCFQRLRGWESAPTDDSNGTRPEILGGFRSCPS